VAELEGLLARYVARPEYARQIVAKHRGPLNTDDRNLLEFGFARSVNRHDLFSMKQALDRSKKHGLDGSAKLEGVEWDTVGPARAQRYGDSGPGGGPPGGGPAKLCSVLFGRVMRGAARGRGVSSGVVERLQELAREGADVRAAGLAF